MAKDIQRYSQPVVSFRAAEMTSEPVPLAHTSDGPWVKYDDHLEALGEEKTRAEKIDERYVNCRAEYLEASQRAEQAEKRLEELHQDLDQELTHLETLSGMSGYQVKVLVGRLRELIEGSSS